MRSVALHWELIENNRKYVLLLSTDLGERITSVRSIR